MNIDTLIFEVTRRCNFKCDHCLRGKARNKDMSEEVINKIFQLNDITSINRLCIGGGEPSLAPHVIGHIANTLRNRGIYVGSLEMTINGGPALRNQTFIDALDSLLYLVDYADESYIAISNTPWHDYQQDYDAINWFKDHFHQVDIEKRGRLQEYHLKYEGMAAENYITCDAPENIIPKDIFSIQFKERFGEYDGIDSINDGNLYINANGWVIPGCDFSYEHQERLKTINVLRDSLNKLAEFSDIYEQSY